MAPRSSHSFLFATPLPRAQRGAVLFLLLLLILVGAGTVFVSQLKSADVELEAQRKTAAALAQAKQALLGAAVWDNGGANPGRLLCPDQDNNGVSQGAACASPYVGRVPRITLGINDVRDGAGERLWYVVDGNFRSGGGAMNTTILPSLTLNGSSVVAVVFAPGGVLSALAQNRATSGVPNPSLARANYLESFFTVPSPLVTTAPLSATFNDQVIGITRQELFTAVTQRMARELAIANPPGAMGFMGTVIGDLAKPPMWSSNNWDAAVDNSVSGVTSSVITLKFVHCVATFTISGPNAVTMNPRSC